MVTAPALLAIFAVAWLGAFCGVFSARAAGAIVVRMTMRRIERQLRAKTQAVPHDEAITPDLPQQVGG